MSSKITDQRMTSAERAALLHATGSDGHIDQLAFHAQRLIVMHEAIDGVDAKALAKSLSAWTRADPPRDLVIEAILARLNAANADSLRHELNPHAEMSDVIARRSRWRSARALLRLCTKHRTRWPETPEISRAMTKERIYCARTQTAKAITAFERYVSREAFLAEFVRNSDFRKTFMGLAGVYSDIDALMDDPTQMPKDGHIRFIAAMALIHWRGHLTEAVAERRRDQYLSERGDVGVDAMLCSVPVDDFWKFGGMAKSYFEVGIDLADPAVVAAIEDARQSQLRLEAQRARRASASGNRQDGGN